MGRGGGGQGGWGSPRPGGVGELPLSNYPRLDADWPWQGVSGGREASLEPGRTSRHVSQCVRDSALMAQALPALGGATPLPRRE